MANLTSTYDTRADRARGDVDLDAMIDDAIADGHRLVRRRRQFVAAGCVGVVVASVAAVAVVLTPTPRRTLPAAEPPSPTPVSSTPAVARLVGAPATPRSAPVSLGLLPAGWRYVGGNSSRAVYARTGDAYADDPERVTGKIVVGPHEAGEPQRKKDFSLEAGRYFATYDGGTDGALLSVYVSKTITVDFEIDATAHLTSRQALDMAASLTIRNVDDPSHG